MEEQNSTKPPDQLATPLRAGHLDLAGHLHNLISDHPDFEVFADPAHEVYSFRYVPNVLAEHQDETEVRELLDRLNQELVEVVQSNGLAHVRKVSVRGCIAIQMSIGLGGNLSSDVDAAFEAIARWGRLLSKKLSVSTDNTSTWRYSYV